MNSERDALSHCVIVEGSSGCQRRPTGQYDLPEHRLFLFIHPFIYVCGSMTSLFGMYSEELMFRESEGERSSPLSCPFFSSITLMLGIAILLSTKYEENCMKILFSS